MYDPVVFEFNTNRPKAELLFPLVLLLRAEIPTAKFCCDPDGFPVPTVTPDIVALLEEVKLLIVPAVKLLAVPIDPE